MKLTLEETIKILKENIYSLNYVDKPLTLPKEGDIIGIFLNFNNDTYFLKYYILEENEMDFIIVPVLENLNSYNLVKLINNFHAYPLMLKLPKLVAYKLEEIASNKEKINKEIYAKVLLRIRDGYIFDDINAAVTLNFDTLNLNVCKMIYKKFEKHLIEEKKETDIAYAAASNEFEGIKDNIFIKQVNGEIFIKNLSSEDKILILKDNNNKKYTLNIYPNEEILIFVDKQIKDFYVI